MLLNGRTGAIYSCNRTVRSFSLFRAFSASRPFSHVSQGVARKLALPWAKLFLPLWDADVWSFCV
jgi:hypothetical protein